MQASEGGLGYQELLWLLGSLCSLYRIPFDPKLVEQDFPPPHSRATFHEAARALGDIDDARGKFDEFFAFDPPGFGRLRGRSQCESESG